MPRGSAWPPELPAYCRELRPLNYPGIRLKLWRLAQATEGSKDWDKAVSLGLLSRVSEDESHGWKKHVPHQDTISRWFRGEIVATTGNVEAAASPTRQPTDTEDAQVETVASTRPSIDQDSEKRPRRGPALEGHLEAIIGGLTSGQAAAMLNIESPANVIGYGPGNVRTREMVDAFFEWASSRQMVHAANHVIKLDIPAQLRQYQVLAEKYVQAMKMVEDRAIDQARGLGLAWQRDEDHKQEVFTDDFWGVSLRWAVGTRLGHHIEVPRATIVRDTPGAEAVGGGQYRLYWLYDSNMRPIAASGSREMMSQAESAFLAWGNRWLEDAGITALLASFHRAYSLLEGLREAILAVSVDDLADGRCVDCPSEALPEWAEFGLGDAADRLMG